MRRHIGMIPYTLVDMSKYQHLAFDSSGLRPVLSRPFSHMILLDTLFGNVMHRLASHFGGAHGKVIMV